jgi:hydrogenase maturation factor HypF (carbamoyltransferase family)
MVGFANPSFRLTYNGVEVYMKKIVVIFLVFVIIGVAFIACNVNDDVNYCPNCRSSDIKKDGSDKIYQFYICKKCNYRFGVINYESGGPPPP